MSHNGLPSPSAAASAAATADTTSAQAEPVVDAQDVTRHYVLGKDTIVEALRGVSLTVPPGAFVSIVGPSGSGKSTLLNLLGALDRPTSGSLRFSGRDVADLSDAELASLRNTDIGFVFQQFHLLGRTPARDNVALPLVYRGESRRERRRRADEALDLVGLAHRRDHRPAELSGGEQQRVAIARALVSQPRLLLADEPTGNLDSQTGSDIMGLLQDLNAQAGVALVVITHDPEVAALAPVELPIRDGVLDQERATAGSLVPPPAVTAPPPPAEPDDSVASQRPPSQAEPAEEPPTR